MKNIIGKTLLLASALLFSITGTSCSNDDNATPEKEKTYDMSGFAKGADVSWLTEMEQNGKKFYDANGKATECMALLRDLGINSIRLRVWVNPDGGWNAKYDVLIKAWRAKNLGMRLMIDFHYSDSWADPGKQNIPAAWNGFKDDLDKMKAAVASHTTDVLQTLKDNGIDVEWIQIGNETRTGMLWPLGKVSNNNFATNDCLANVSTLATRYNCKVMVSEIGMPWDSENAAAMMKKMVDGCKAKPECLGIFYWEPECYGGWNGYSKGAFDSNGKSTEALNAFKN